MVVINMAVADGVCCWSDDEQREAGEDAASVESLGKRRVERRLERPVKNFISDS